MEREKAIEVVKEAMPTLWKETKEAIQTLVPELAESEDEKMRKRAIAILKQQRDFWSYDGPVDKFPPATPKKDLVDAIDVALSYLENQKEPKLVTFEEPYNSDEYEVVEIGNATCLRRKEQKPIEQIEDDERKSIGTTLIDALKGNAQLEWALKRAGVNIKKLITYLEQKEQKLTEWSEEDATKIGTLSAIISDYAFYKDALDENNDLTGEYAELEDWLECLPERFELLSKQEWNENDEAAFGDLMWCIEQARKSAKDENDMGNIWFAENWVKTRLKSFRPQPKQERSEEQKPSEFSGELGERLKSLCPKLEQKWSEEDRKMLNTIISDGSRGVELDAKQINFLKSLCPQYCWKPSEQEKSALRGAIHIFTNERNFPKTAAHLQNILDAFEGEEPRKEWKPTEEQMMELRASYAYWQGTTNATPDSRLLESLYNDLKNIYNG